MDACYSIVHRSHHREHPFFCCLIRVLGLLHTGYLHISVLAALIVTLILNQVERLLKRAMYICSHHFRPAADGPDLGRLHTILPPL